jgi:NAD(P)-dependent dehydrogenase (short-subunit alcohol dehydrogenase family)
MSRVFITGSADGLGLMAARLLIADGHEVLLHARSRARGEEALLGAPGAAGVLVGDLSSIRQTRELADSVNAEGRFDAVIHNAGVGTGDQIATTTSSWNFSSSTQAPHPVSVYFASVPLEPGKTVASVTLPTVSSGIGQDVTAMHIFALAIGSGVPTSGASSGATITCQIRFRARPVAFATTRAARR